VEGRTVKVSYVGGVPEVQVKLTECFGLKEHPVVCEGRLPVRLVLGTPDGKRLAVTEDWPGYLAREWPKQRAVVMKKFPGHGWR
jgi:ATP-dependent helicase HrpB